MLPPTTATVVTDSLVGLLHCATTALQAAPAVLDLQAWSGLICAAGPLLGPGACGRGGRWHSRCL